MHVTSHVTRGACIAIRVKLASRACAVIGPRGFKNTHTLTY